MSQTVEPGLSAKRSTPLIPLREMWTLDLRSLALLRVGLGVLLILDWLDRLPDLRAHFSDEGIVPRFALEYIIPFSIQVFSGAVWFQGLLAAVALLLAVLLIVGYRTPVVLFLSWLLLLGAHGRNVVVLQGGDMVLRLLMFWGLFLPLGACWSIDGADSRAGPKTRSLVSMESVAFIVQLCLVYLFASAWKWAPEWRDDGSAVHQALSVACFPSRFGNWLRDQVGLCRWLTFSTLYLESLGPAVLFLPFSVSLQRLLVITSFVLFHVGLAISIELANFPWVCCVAWLALLPGAFWDRLGARLRPPRLAEWTIWFDPSHPRAGRWLARMQTVLFLGPAKLQEVSGGVQPWGVIDPEGNNRRGQEALVLLWKLSPVFSPLAGLMTTRVGAWLAAHLAGPALPEAPAADRPSIPAWTPAQGALSRWIVFLCLVYVILWNIGSFGERPNPAVLPEKLQQVGWVLGLDQGWGLFAPRPGRLSGWYLMIGTCADGSQVDLYNGGKPVDRTRPELVSATYANGRWRKLITNLSASGSSGPLYRNLLEGYSSYLFREWNREHTGPKKLGSVEIIYMQEEVMPPGVPIAPPQAISLYKYTPRDR